MVVQLVVWVGFTHLQGRFLVLLIPAGAIAIGTCGARRWPTVAVVGVAIIALVSLFVNGSRHNDKRPGVAALADAGALGVEDLKWLVEGQLGVDLEKLPADRPVVLVGEAQAFFYQLPMARLRYRTVFDVPGVKDEEWLRAWTGGEAGTVSVFPGELGRFRRTYFGVPTPAPEELQRWGKPFVMTR
jgi:hypothetical protein